MQTLADIEIPTIQPYVHAVALELEHVSALAFSSPLTIELSTTCSTTDQKRCMSSTWNWVSSHYMRTVSAVVSSSRLSRVHHSTERRAKGSGQDARTPRTKLKQVGEETRAHILSSH